MKSLLVPAQQIANVPSQAYSFSEVREAEEGKSVASVYKRLCRLSLSGVFHTSDVIHMKFHVRRRGQRCAFRTSAAGDASVPGSCQLHGRSAALALLNIYLSSPALSHPVPIATLQHHQNGPPTSLRPAMYILCHVGGWMQSQRPVLWLSTCLTAIDWESCR
jgi:hypothetical protein